jgi:hypothetical protein
VLVVVAALTMGAVGAVLTQGAAKNTAAVAR